MSDRCCRHSRYWMHTRSFHTRLKQVKYLKFYLSCFSFFRWKSDVNSFPSLDSQIQNGPTFVYEYNTRETYGQNITGWGPNDPLNATWWHHVTEGTHNFIFFDCIKSQIILWIYVAMEADPSLVAVSFSSSVVICFLIAPIQTFNTLQGKGSVLTPECVGNCTAARICYMRSGSVPIAIANCIPGFNSVQ